jgi:sulfur carrier protein
VISSRRLHDGQGKAVKMGETVGGERVLALNGRRISSRSTMLAELLDEQGFGDAKVATAVNGEFVPERLREKTALQAGDRVEVVSVRQGG